MGREEKGGEEKKREGKGRIRKFLDPPLCAVLTS